jgi:alpha-ketoglutarate-dependent taurine dioxygenase
MRAAAQELKTNIPPDLDAACDYFDELSNRPDLRLEFMLEPGEMMIWNNFTTLHARKAFEDKAERTRHLLRLWLNVPQGRPVVPEVLTWGRIYDTLMKERSAKAAVN